jgi:nitronate monooxygenase
VLPIVQAPLAGGASTPALTAAVVEAGAFGFVAAGYKTPDALREDLRATRALTSKPFGVNLFVPGGEADPAAYAEYVARLRAEADAHGVALGEPRFDDDAWDAKLELLEADPVAVVSFTFGCPAADVVARLHAVGSQAWVTVTDVAEAKRAADAGADALVVQGVEAGGHRASFVDSDDAGEYGLLALLQVVRAHVDLPLVASGGIATGGAIAAVLCAGARAAQIGTAFMRTREAPIAYPNIHHATAPLRAAGRTSGDADVLNLWAGQTHELAREVPAAELVAALVAEAAESLDAARRALSPRADA